MHRKEEVPPGHPPDPARRKARAFTAFRALRDEICAACEGIEDALGSGPHADLPPGRFERTAWRRPGGGGGVMSILRGRVFEKMGVNVSEVHGEFPPNLAREIPGSAEDPSFWAAGISLVAHPRSPRVPAAHMNVRHIMTDRWWFGGGGDLTPSEPFERDTADFHAAYRAACDAADPSLYEIYRRWCDEYFHLPHRGEARGVGGVFFDYRNTGNWERDFDFALGVGRAYLDAHPPIVRRRMGESWTPAERERQLAKRGRYVEFNLAFDRGTRFGLLTGGNPEAVLMSLPPLAAWP